MSKSGRTRATDDKCKKGAKAVIGILAFQGDFSRHCEVFERLGCEVRLVKRSTQLSEIECLVIPGGESSVIDRFIRQQEMREAIIEFSECKPVWGSCAGMILLASKVTNDRSLSPLNLIDIEVERNAYGRQIESFVAVGEFSVEGSGEPLPMVFIRAPKVISTGEGVEILGTCRDETVIVRQGNAIATSFHPELTDSQRFQEFFLSLISSRQK
jgi:5'-phosphate synthase pdxT subunit